DAELRPWLELQVALRIVARVREGPEGKPLQAPRIGQARIARGGPSSITGGDGPLQLHLLGAHADRPIGERAEVAIDGIERIGEGTVGELLVAGGDHPLAVAGQLALPETQVEIPVQVV